MATLRAALGAERLATFAQTRIAAVVLAAWAAAEAIVLPIVPDVGLCVLALAAPRHAPRLFAAVVVGALAGTAVLAILTAQAPDAVRSMLLALPGINPGVLADAHDAIGRDGILAFVQFGPGAPLKVDTADWLARGGDAPGLLIGAVLNRLTRIGPVVLVAALIGAVGGETVRRPWTAVLAAYAAFWVIVYAVLWGTA